VAPLAADHVAQNQQRPGVAEDLERASGDDMSLVRVRNFSISLDGFGIGEVQQLDAPFGHAGSSR
jgi:hypothetical protein